MLLNVETREYFGCTVEVGTVPPGNWECAPWRFAIKRGEKTWKFFGVPNYCSSKKEALKRAWWRCKWISEGTYDKKYCRPF